jgi:hypothetical protein
MLLTKGKTPTSDRVFPGGGEPTYEYTTPADDTQDPSADRDSAPLESVGSGRARFELQGLTHDGGLLLNFSYDSPEEQAPPPSSPRRMTAAPQVHGIEAPGGLLFDVQQPTVAVAGKAQKPGSAESEPSPAAGSGTVSPVSNPRAQDTSEGKSIQVSGNAVYAPIPSMAPRGTGEEDVGTAAGQAVPSHTGVLPTGAEPRAGPLAHSGEARHSPVSGLPQAGQESAGAQPIYLAAGSVARVIISKGPAGGADAAGRVEDQGRPTLSRPIQGAVQGQQDALAPPNQLAQEGRGSTRTAPGEPLGERARETGIRGEGVPATEGRESPRKSPQTGGVGGGDGSESREAFAEAAQETAHAAAVKATEVQLDEAADEGREACVIPPLRIAILVAGTRGDVQPFVALALALKVRFLCASGWDR